MMMFIYLLETKARRGDKGYGRLGATVSLLHILYTYDINGGGEIEVTVTSKRHAQTHETERAVNKVCSAHRR